jgi:soluble lytic murein transglycosylase
VRIRPKSLRPEDCRRLIALALTIVVLASVFFLTISLSSSTSDTSAVPSVSAASTDSATTPGITGIEGGQIPGLLLSWPQPAPDVLIDILRSFKQCMDCYDQKDYAAALKIFPSDQDAVATPIGDYILLYKARVHLTLKDYQQALDVFRFAERHYPDSTLLRELVLGQCRALLELKDPDAILTLLDRHSMSFPDPEAGYYRARALHLQGKDDIAIPLYLDIYVNHPTSRFASDAERHLVSLAPRALTGANNYTFRVQRAENLMRANDHRGARNLLAVLGKVSAPDTMTAQKQQLLLADADFQLYNTRQALALVQKTTFTDPQLHARALYIEGASLRRLGNERAFIDTRDRALKLYPDSPDTEELCYSVATYFDVNYDTEKAAEAYKILYDAFPQGRHTERALWKVSLFHYLNGRYAEAAHGFWNHLRLNHTPVSASSALYWMGRSYEKAGNTQKAEYLYGRAYALGNRSFYGQLSRQAATALPQTIGTAPASFPGIDFDEVTSFCNTISLKPFVIFHPDDNGIETITRAGILAMAGLHDQALEELRERIRLSPQNSDSLHYLTARVFAEHKEDFQRTIRNLHTVFPGYNGHPSGSLPEEVWRMFFPVRHWEIISPQAAGNNLEPCLILGLIRQESAFQVNARSGADARGLMQILPSTGKGIAQRMKIDNFSAAGLYQPNLNITLGINHLARLKKRYGRTEVALAAYNAGESRANRWLQEFGDTDMAEFVEQIPFRETRNYVKQVLTNKFHYEILIPGAMTASHQGAERFE